jgi:hypothetical protein
MKALEVAEQSLYPLRPTVASIVCTLRRTNVFRRGI